MICSLYTPPSHEVYIRQATGRRARAGASDRGTEEDKEGEGTVSSSSTSSPPSFLPPFSRSVWVGHPPANLSVSEATDSHERIYSPLPSQGFLSPTSSSPSSHRQPSSVGQRSPADTSNNLKVRLYTLITSSDRLSERDEGRAKGRNIRKGGLSSTVCVPQRVGWEQCRLQGTQTMVSMEIGSSLRYTWADTLRLKGCG
jgi:hypothetical protein